MNKTAQDALRGAALAASEPTEQPSPTGRQPMREAIEKLIFDLEERVVIVNQSMHKYKMDHNEIGEALNKGKEAAYQSVVYRLREVLKSDQVPS